MQYVVLRKDRLDEFISRLAKEQKVMAPVARGERNFAFEEVKSAKDIALKYIPTILPPKKYFMPQKETLVEYDMNGTSKCVVEYEKMVLFGVHTCDLGGIGCLNMVFNDHPKDINYMVRKSKIALIGLECNQYCDEHASCALMGYYLPQGGYDLFFTDIGEEFLVHVNTLLGNELVEKTGVFDPVGKEHLGKLEDVRAKKREIFKPEVDVESRDIPQIFDKSWESPVWKDLDKRCVACGNCTNVCPTCYCFNIIDEPNLDLKTGSRYRVWDSCQNETFAKVATGENFREKRGSRQRHRYYRKFNYPVKRYARFFCTGCGRCTRTCMAKINLKETLRALVKENS